MKTLEIKVDTRYADIPAVTVGLNGWSFIGVCSRTELTTKEIQWLEQNEEAIVQCLRDMEQYCRSDIPKYQAAFERMDKLNKRFCKENGIVDGP